MPSPPIAAARAGAGPPGAPPLPVGQVSAAQRAALLAAVAAHDTVYPDAEPPPAIPLDVDGRLIADGYRLSLALWREVDLRRLAGIAARLARGGRLDDADRRGLKDVRMRAKQLRFAYATLDRRHAYPARLDRVTRLMGQAQDAVRSGRRWKAAAKGVALRLATTRRAQAALAREADGFRAADPASLRAHILADLDTVRAALATPALTNKAFHDTRKVVSRLVAFWDTLTVLAPSADHQAVDRYLSTINGLMGALHDDMAARKAVSRSDYHEVAEPLPPEIARRLARLVGAFDAAQAAAAAPDVRSA